MAPESRRSLPDLRSALSARPGAFQFAQAVRVAEDAGAGLRPAALSAAGHDENPADEAVRFKVAPSLSFAAAPVRAARVLPSGAVELEVTFAGLTGPSGVLPQHYTELLIQRLQKRDRALAEFTDLLHHRTLALFHRASTKYRLASSHEQAWRWSRDREPFEHALSAIVGRGLAPTSRLRATADRAWLRFAAHYARSARSAIGLQSLLADFLDLPVQVRQFVGRWVEIPDEALSRLPSRAEPRGRNLTLGGGAVLGRRAWDLGSKVRLELGPMSTERFLELRPDGELMARVRHMVTDYTDGLLDFEVALHLLPSAQLETKLSVRGASEARLGWTARLSARNAAQAQSRVLFSLAAS